MDPFRLRADNGSVDDEGRRQGRHVHVAATQAEAFSDPYRGAQHDFHAVDQDPVVGPRTILPRDSPLLHELRMLAICTVVSVDSFFSVVGKR
ncbi:hypothetical protein [Cryobacterium sp. LW097]|uniref:hypothetical protein n=1 Tax=Cryobacterium sp. LW097 TaxID=1978566 RepID=UPI0012491AAC|nr:hypothetical protein [Cryobacterium sp. LW097]